MNKATIELGTEAVEVSYTYSHDAGVHTHSNGDPGYPPYTEIELHEVHWKGLNVTALVLGMEDKYEEIETDIFERLEL